MAVLRQLATVRLVRREMADGAYLNPAIPLGKVYVVDLLDTAEDRIVGDDGVVRIRPVVRCTDGSWLPSELLSGGNA